MVRYGLGCELGALDAAETAIIVTMAAARVNLNRRGRGIVASLGIWTFDYTMGAEFSERVRGNRPRRRVDSMYLVSVILLLLVFPAASVAVELAWSPHGARIMPLIGRWYVFWAGGIRLFIAGLRQVLQP